MHLLQFAQRDTRKQKHRLISGVFRYKPAITASQLSRGAISDLSPQ
jgi:hypothetical protein